MSSTSNMNNNRSNNIFTNTNTNGKGARTNKKIDEVKEVIQNKADAEIQKVLEYFEYDVGKTIDAFVNDGGKEALAKWQETKAANKRSTNQHLKNSFSSQNDDQHNNNESQNHVNNTNGSNLLQFKNNKNNSKINNNNNNNNKLDLKASLNLGKDQQQHPQNNNSNKQKVFSSSLSAKKTSNINDLVASVINQYTNSTPTTPLSGSISANMQLLANEVDTTHQEQQNQSLLDNLNRLVISSQTSSASTATIGGFKVTVLGVQTNKNDTINNNTQSRSPVISSISSSPSSMSVTSNLSMSSSMNGHRSSLLDMNKQHILPMNAQMPAEKRVFNTSYVNPNARQILEKHQKDLQRQTIVLNRISSVFQDDLNKSQQSLNQTFAQLRQLLNDRQAQLETQLIAAAQTGSNLLQQRQSKAAELKILADNAQHLNDAEAQELKADIKHFVSERQLDEEFGKLKFLNFDNLMQLNQSINSLGSITTLTNKYAKQRPPIDQINDTPPRQQAQSNNSIKLNGNHSNTNNATDKNNNKHQMVLTNGANDSVANNSAPKLNGNAKIINQFNGFNNENDDEGEFIEVKKPQRNKNRQQQQAQQPQGQQQQPQQPQQLTNGHKNSNANNKKFPKQNGFNNNTSNQYTTVAIK